MPAPILVSFFAGNTGPWRIDSISPVIGETLPDADRLNLIEGGPSPSSDGGSWLLRGTTSNLRYTTRDEANRLTATQQGLGRDFATCAALIPIRKSEAWWNLAQDERRTVFEEKSRHIAIGSDYLPAISRRLHHSRELAEPFDFLTWFEYAPEQSAAFETMVRRLRDTAEWRFVDREVDIRLRR
jgi:hypothetical protein